MAVTKQRTKIVDAIKTRLNTLFGPSATLEKLFEEVRRCKLRPAPQRPMATVLDDGQSRGGNDDDTSTERLLQVRIALHLFEDWEKAPANQEWEDNVEKIIFAMENYLPPYGCLSVKYQSDEPFDVLFLGGASEAIWVINFEVKYEVETEEPDNR